MVNLTLPEIVGTSFLHPKIASVIVIGKSMYMSFPSRLNNGCSLTLNSK